MAASGPTTWADLAHSVRRLHYPLSLPKTGSAPPGRAEQRNPALLLAAATLTPTRSRVADSMSIRAVGELARTLCQLLGCGCLDDTLWGCSRQPPIPSPPLANLAAPRQQAFRDMRERLLPSSEHSTDGECDLQHSASGSEGGRGQPETDLDPLLVATLATNYLFNLSNACRPAPRRLLQHQGACAADTVAVLSPAAAVAAGAAAASGRGTRDRTQAGECKRALRTAAPRKPRQICGSPPGAPPRERECGATRCQPADPAASRWRVMPSGTAAHVPRNDATSRITMCNMHSTKWSDANESLNLIRQRGHHRLGLRQHPALARITGCRCCRRRRERCCRGAATAAAITTV